MPFEFKFPDVGEGIREGKIISWLVEEKQFVEVDHPILKVETDKAVVEITSPKRGKILKILKKEGEIVNVGEVLVIIETEEPKKEKITELKEPKEKIVQERETLPPLATPRIRQMAREMGLDISKIKGTGKGGRITEEDLKRAKEGEKIIIEEKKIEEKLEKKVLKISTLRKTIAKNMSNVHREVPMVWHMDEADVEKLYEIYQKLKAVFEEKYNLNLTIFPLFIKFLIPVLKKYPIFNSTFSFEKEEIYLNNEINIGFAVATLEGLIVPVIKNTEKKNLVEITKNLLELKERALSRKITLEEMHNSTFTITNIGPIGGVFATPLINLPNVAILGIHKIEEKVVPYQGNIVIRKKINFTIGFDHRIIDGAEAAYFLNDYINFIENPELLFLEV